jgi:hypothetical protein
MTDEEVKSEKAPTRKETVEAQKKEKKDEKKE